MRLPLIFLILLFGFSPLKAEPELLLGRAEWSVPKTADAILAMPVLQEAMKQLQASEQSILKIYYPGGDEGSLWAIELRGWLVSLGLEADRMQLVSGSQYQDRLQLQITE